MSLERKGQCWQAGRQLVQERVWTLHRQVWPQISARAQLCDLGQITSPPGLNIFTCNWGLIIATSQECQEEMMGVKTLTTGLPCATSLHPAALGLLGSVN